MYAAPRVRSRRTRRHPAPPRARDRLTIATAAPDGEALSTAAGRAEILEGVREADDPGVVRHVIRDTDPRHATRIEAPPRPRARPAVPFTHVTLPTGILRKLGPCNLSPGNLAMLRERVLPKLRRGSLVLPAQPRYRLSGSIGATGGRLFALRTRHGADRIVARIGIGWREHGANLVWQECARAGELEPPRPWVVDAVDSTGIQTLNPHEVTRVARWLPALARELAWAVVPEPETSGDVLPPPTLPGRLILAGAAGRKRASRR